MTIKTYLYRVRMWPNWLRHGAYVDLLYFLAYHIAIPVLRAALSCRTYRADVLHRRVIECLDRGAMERTAKQVRAEEES